MTEWKDENFVAADFETDAVLQEYALQPWRAFQGPKVWWPTSFVGARVVSDPKPRWEYYVDRTMPQKLEIKKFLRDAIDLNLTIICWNALYDIQCFLALGDDMRPLVRRAKWLDGMLLWKHFFIEPEYDMTRGKKKSYSLKEAVRELLPDHADYEADITYHNPTPEQLVELHKYNRKDTTFTYWLTKYFWERLEPAQLRAALIEAKSLPFVAEANLDGMRVDYLLAKELGVWLERTAAARLKTLAPHGVTEKVVRSPVQLSKLMFDVWGLPVLKENKSKKTGNVTRSTDKEVLHELAFVDPRAKELREFREALGNKTKFADTPLEAAAYNGDGRAHPQAIVFGTYSGRMTYASKQGKNKDERQIGFALHQEKRDKVFRNIIVAPDGYDLVEFDASGQEFRWMACASGDKTMQALCMPGEDPHAFMGARIEEIDYQRLMADVKKGVKHAKDARQLGKVGNLSLQYRTSAPKLRVVARVQYNLPMELPQARTIHRKYQQTYPGVPIYWENQIRQTRKLGYVETFAGRRVQVVGDWMGDFAWSMGSTAINYRIQGTGADQKYLAFAVLKAMMNDFDVRFAWDLHDGMYFYVPQSKTEKFRIAAKNKLDNLPYKQAWGYQPPIPMPWDCKVGPAWGLLEEVK